MIKVGFVKWLVLMSICLQNLCIDKCRVLRPTFGPWESFCMNWFMGGSLTLEEIRNKYWIVSEETDFYSKTKKMDMKSIV